MVLLLKMEPMNGIEPATYALRTQGFTDTLDFDVISALIHGKSASLTPISKVI